MTEQQNDGTACVVCGLDFTLYDVPSVPVGPSETGSQTFACTNHPS